MTDRMLPPMATTALSLMLLSCLMLLSQVQGEVQKELPYPLIRCPQGSQYWATHCYALYTTQKSWHEAELSCENWPSGHLLSVLSAEETSYVSSFLKSRVHNYRYVWIGLHDPTLGYESYGDAWQWSNNNKLKYANWERNPFTATDRGYCASLTAKSGYMKWRDYPCDMLLPYVCKFKN